jgi:hypothetical protein
MKSLSQYMYPSKLFHLKHVTKSSERTNSRVQHSRPESQTHVPRGSVDALKVEINIVHP